MPAGINACCSVTVYSYSTFVAYMIAGIEQAKEMLKCSIDTMVTTIASTKYRTPVLLDTPALSEAAAAVVKLSLIFQQH